MIADPWGDLVGAHAEERRREAAQHLRLTARLSRTARLAASAKRLLPLREGQQANATAGLGGKRRPWSGWVMHR